MFRPHGPSGQTIHQTLRGQKNRSQLNSAPARDPYYYYILNYPRYSLVQLYIQLYTNIEIMKLKRFLLVRTTPQREWNLTHTEVLPTWSYFRIRNARQVERDQGDRPTSSYP